MSAAYMKKWEEKNRTRHHHRRIQSAKSTVRKTARGNQRIVDAKPQTQYTNPSTEFDFYSAGDSSDTTRPSSSKISDYYSYEKENLPQIPLYRLLKHFSLQQYAKALISRGYGYNIAKLGTVSKEGFEELMNDINVLPGHKVKLRQVLSQITQVCSEIIEQESLNFSTEDLQAHKVAGSQIPKPSTAQARPGGRQVYRSTPKQETKKPSSAIAGRRPLSTKTNYQNQKKNENLEKIIMNKEEIAKNNKAKIVKLESIGADFFSDSNDDSNNDEFSLILNNIIEKYQHDEEPNKGKSFYKAPLDVQKKDIQTSQTEDLLQKVDKIYNNERKTKVTTQPQPVKPQSPTKTAGQKLNAETKAKAKSKETIKTEPASQKTKSNTLPGKEAQKKPEPAKTEEVFEISPKMKARVMDLLQDKLDSSNLNRDDLNLEFKKINDLYSSFDGAKMTSTIANIDIEEMCHCFACAIQKHIEHFITNVYPLGDTYALKTGKAGNESKSFKDDNKENVKNLDINKAVTKAPIETKSKTQPKPKPKEDKEEQIQEEIEYNDGDDYFIYKGKKIPIGGYDVEEDQITSDRHGSIFSKEKDDEVMHDEDDDGFYEDDFETEDNIKDLKEKPQQNEAYDEEEFNDFLRQSLRENLFDTLKRGSLPPQIDEQRLRLDQVCQTKSNIKALLEPNDEDIEEDLTEEEERPEYSEFSFTMEESQYREIELSTEELDQAQKIKRLFEKTYNEKNLTPEEYNKKIKDTVGKETISNFCKNLMVTSKMEKEVIIVSLVYVERLIIKTGLYLNSVNWKKICFTSFVLASKIWDDESFENEHFAKVFPQYTVKDINELEKVFLELIDYDLRVNGTDYAKYYFILRTFAEKNKRSFALKPMNVQVVRMLQNKAEGTAQSLKSKYSQNTNRSFM